jgi:predicted RecB family nuclease
MDKYYRTQMKAQLANPIETLNQPATSLIGVTPDAAEVLKHFGIFTVQDLAGSNLFNVASQIYEASQPLRKQGRKRELSVLPSDFFDREKINTLLS